MSEQIIPVITATQFDGSNDQDIIDLFTAGLGFEPGSSRSGSVLTIEIPPPGDDFSVNVGDWVGNPNGAPVLPDAEVVKLSDLQNPA